MEMINYLLAAASSYVASVPKNKKDTTRLIKA